MTLTLHAHPYDITAYGFYFDSYEAYAEKAAKAVNAYGGPVEEFEIQFIDGEDIDCELAKIMTLQFIEPELWISDGFHRDFGFPRHVGGQA